MPLKTGAHLGPYRVDGKLGEGGMGEVYTARDTRLDRDVAVKVLPGHLAADPEALARFEREAKAIAALSHPNILAIHDFGQDAGIVYAVTERLEGHTLRERLATGPLPRKKAIQIAADVARGLAAAHGRGIVHRDLKPENVFITSDGLVKILDFGLAKSVVPSDQTSVSAPEATQLATEPGTVMGTVGYMAPEQVRGAPADPRADIFALGCVLFEMLVGRRAFQRETAAETMTAILREDVPGLSDTGIPVPPALEELVRHCLEKQPDERFQSARDLAFALEALSGAQPTSGTAVAVSGVSSKPRRLPLVAVAALAVAAGFLVGRFSPASQTPAAPVISTFTQVTDFGGVETTPTLSPDGQAIVYATAEPGDLYLLRVGSRRPVLLTANSPAHDGSPAFSPDGERIAFRSERDRGGIFVMTATGESVTRLGDSGFDPSWSPDGSSIVVAPARFVYPTDVGSNVLGLSVIDVATGARREISTVDRAMQPSWSPNGFRVAFWGLRGDGGQRDIWTIAADGSEAERGGRTVTDDAALDWNPVWSPDGRHVYFSSNRGGTMNLWRVPIDERTGEVLGDAEPVTTPSLWSGGVTFSRDGRLMAFASLDWRSTLYRVAFDPVREELAGAPEPLRQSTRPIRDHELSPDGEWVTFMETGAQEDLFVARTDGSEYRRLTDDQFRDRSPVWSPDGSRLAFYSDRSGDYQVWTIRPDGSDLRQVTHSTRASLPTWSPDGTLIATAPVGGSTWFVVPADGGDAAEIEHAAPGDSQYWPASWSSAGRIVGLNIPMSGASMKLAIYDIASDSYRDVPNATSGNWVIGLWLDARRLLVRDERGIAVFDLDGGSRRILSVGGYAMGRSLGASRDGRWISYTETGTQGDIWMATLR